MRTHQPHLTSSLATTLVEAYVVLRAQGPRDGYDCEVQPFLQSYRRLVGPHLYGISCGADQPPFSRVASLILCHDRPKTRAKQIERFVEIGVSLRVLNNYSGLRALVAGINAATYSGDLPMELFKQRALEAYKSYQSWDLLFQAIRSHRAYRMALRNTKGACIPAL